VTRKTTKTKVELPAGEAVDEKSIASILMIVGHPISTIRGLHDLIASYSAFRAQESMTSLYMYNTTGGPVLLFSSKSSPVLSSNVRWPAMLSYGGTVWISGGHSTTADASFGGCRDFLQYDSTSNTWTQRAPMIKARKTHVMFGRGAYLYVLGGFGEFWGTPAAEIYDIKADQWQICKGSFRPEMLSLIFGASVAGSSVVVGDRVYLVGGSYLWCLEFLNEGHYLRDTGLHQLIGYAAQVYYLCGRITVCATNVAGSIEALAWNNDTQEWEPLSWFNVPEDTEIEDVRTSCDGTIQISAITSDGVVSSTRLRGIVIDDTTTKRINWTTLA
jgi:hypothetical protein